MGYTSFTISKITPFLSTVKSVLDLGAQNNYAQPKLPAPYMREWYETRGIKYTSIDLNGECGAMEMDLAQLIGIYQMYDLVTDCGTSEHVGSNGAFDWEAIYNCWLNKHNALRIGGIMYNENPKTGNWPGHGFQYYTSEFYNQIVQKSGYKIIEIGEHPAMGNTTDGWNIYCILLKLSNEFPTLEDFKKFKLLRQ